MDQGLIFSIFCVGGGATGAVMVISLLKEERKSPFYSLNEVVLHMSFIIVF